LGTLYLHLASLCWLLCCTASFRALGKGGSSSLKLAGLRLAAAVAETLPHNDRNTAVVQAEAWKLLEKHMKVSSSTLAGHDLLQTYDVSREADVP
jgi:hypothetical protein